MASVATKLLWVVGGCAGLTVAGFLALFLFVVLFNRVEVPVYTHAPTADLFETDDLDAPKLAPFTADGVTVRATFTQGYPEVRVSFASKTGGTVTFERVTVGGRGAKESEQQTVDVGEALELKLSKDGKLHYVGKTVQLDLKGKEFDALGVEGYRVVVTFHVGDQPPHSIELLFDVTVKTAIAWPT